MRAARRLSYQCPVRSGVLVLTDEAWKTYEITLRCEKDFRHESQEHSLDAGKIELFWKCVGGPVLKRRQGIAANAAKPQSKEE